MKKVIVKSSAYKLIFKLNELNRETLLTNRIKIKGES